MEMGEGMIPAEVKKEAERFQAGKTGDEAWAEKMIHRGEEKRAREEERAREQRAADEETLRRARKEAEPTQKLKARLEDGSVAQIAPEFAGTEVPVRLEFRKVPEAGVLLYLEKPEEFTDKGKIGFRKFFRVEEPMGFVQKQEGTVYLRAEPVPPEDFETRKTESQDMREYLTDNTLEQLKVDRPKSQPEALRQAA